MDSPVSVEIQQMGQFLRRPIKRRTSHKKVLRRTNDGRHRNLNAPFLTTHGKAPFLHSEIPPRWSLRLRLSAPAMIYRDHNPERHALCGITIS
jgi:hypothetical protein